MKKEKINKIALSLFLFSLFIPISIHNIQFSDISFRRVKEGYLQFLLNALSPEVIATIESPAKFVVHSASSGTGQGAIKNLLLAQYYGDRFQRFLLYTTRERRGIVFRVSDRRYPAVKEYIDSASKGSSLPSLEQLIEKYNLQDLSERELAEMRSVLEPDWKQLLAGAPRTDIPSLAERFEINDEGIIAYTEFNGIHYWFVSNEELFRLRDEKGVIVEPVREHFQGLDVVAIEDTFKIGNPKIVILEGDRIWFEHVKKRFPNTTSIFISPISDIEFKERMIDQLGEEWRDVVLATNIPQLLKGGIEGYLANIKPEIMQFPEGLTTRQRIAFLNIRNAAIAAMGYKITHPESDIRTWLNSTGLVREEDLEIIAGILGYDFMFDSVVEVVEKTYSEIESNSLVLVAMRIIIKEIAGRIEYRLNSQNQDPNNPRIAGNTYVRASQSPREYAGSVDYGDILVNKWGDLNSSVQNLTLLILRRLWEAYRR